MLPSMMCRGMQHLMQGITLSTFQTHHAGPQLGQTTDGPMVRSPRLLASLPVQKPLEENVLKKIAHHIMRTEWIP